MDTPTMDDFTVMAQVIPVISTKKTPFIEGIVSHRNNQL